MLKWLNKHLIRILLPIFIVAVVIGAVNSDQEKIGCTIATTGTVIETNIRTQRVEGGKYNLDRIIHLHTPTIRYIIDGKSYEKEFSGSIEPIWQAGQEVRILYNPDKPKVSILPEEHDGYASRYKNGGTILWCSVCIVFFIVSICIGTWMDKNRERNALEKQAKKERIESGEEEKEKKPVFKIYVKPIAMVLLFFIYISIVGRLGEISILWSIAGIALPAAAILGTLCYLLARQDRNEKKQCSVCVVGHPSRRFSVKDGYDASNPVRMKYEYQVITY